MATHHEDHDTHQTLSTSITQKTQMLCCNFNQDGSCLSVGTTEGFVIYTLNPSGGAGGGVSAGAGRGSSASAGSHQKEVQLSVNRQHLSGGIGYIEMLFRCNLLVLVGGGNSPYNHSHKVLIWDDHSSKVIGELSFRQIVLSVKLRRDSIAVSLRDRIYVYNLSDLSLRDKIYTTDNPLGLLSLSTSASADMVLACPSVTVGHVRVELYGLRKTVLMEAHESSLRDLCLNQDGTKLITASVKGTIIRVWDVSSGNSGCIQEFRRGYERTSITCLAWSYSSDYIACCSDKGTTHVFSLVDYNNEQHKKNNNNETKSTPAAKSSSSSSKSMTSRLFKSISKTVVGSASHSSSSSSSTPSSSHHEKKSITQLRGIPHPKICAFLPDQSNVITTVGYDADGNGVIMKHEFYDTNPITMHNTSGGDNIVANSDQNSSIVSHHHNVHPSPHHSSGSTSHREPRRICYHVIAKIKATSKNSTDDDDDNDDDDVIEDETKQRRRRMLGLTPSGDKVPGTEPKSSKPDVTCGSPSRKQKKGNTGHDVSLTQGLHMGERLEILEGMKNIVVQEEEDDDGFIAVSTKPKVASPRTTHLPQSTDDKSTNITTKTEEEKKDDKGEKTEEGKSRNASTKSTNDGNGEN